MKCHIVLAFLVAFSASAEDGVFLQDSAGSVKASMQDREVVLRVPVTKTIAPKARCILLVDSPLDTQLAHTPEGFSTIGLFLSDVQPVARHECAILVILDKPAAEEPARVVVLGGEVFWDVHVNRPLDSRPSGWLTLPVATRQIGPAYLSAAGRLFGVQEDHLFDVRLADEQRATPAKVHGQLSQKDVNEIRRTVFAMALQYMLKELANRSPEGWTELLRKWPGRHALDISSKDGLHAAVYYAPNAGYQMEKINGKWMIVGG